MTKSDHLTPQDLAAFEAWTEKFWMFIEDKGDALHIWEAASVHTAKRCAALAERTDPALASAIRAEFRID
ncbi:MAG: hypothetical protein ABI277_13270 [Burkholderiaceae bacterium]